MNNRTAFKMLLRSPVKTALMVVVLLLLLLSACSAEKKLSAEALKEMRERYPYCRTNASAATLPEEYWAKGNDVFVVVELTEGKRETTRTMYPNHDLDPDLATDVTSYYFPAKIIEILDIRDGCSLTEADIVLSFPGLLYDPDIAFDKGQRIVVFGTFEEPVEAGKTQLGIGPIMSFYLTDDNYILSLSNHAQMDQFSGMKLDAFKKEMLHITEVGGWHPR